MNMFWYFILAALFLAAAVLAVPREDAHTPPPDPRGVMMQIKP